MPWCRSWAGLILSAGLLGLVVPTAAGQEFRALWVDAFHAGFRTPAEVTQLLADARAGHFNAVIVEVRKRGDAYYDSRFEPRATDISPAGYDPLADLIARAHDPAQGPRLEVHAWIVTYPIWASQSTTPPQANHPYNLHPDWLTRNNAGATWNGGHFAFDPGHPGVQQHTFNVAMDLISRYDLDGLNFDYVRYSGREWGYNPVAVERFNRRFGRTGQPAIDDPLWLQFRRDQVSALVRKVYLSAAAVKPQVKISADTICFAPGVTTTAGWTNSSAAYTDVLQDWRAWMEEGILDLNIPMNYINQAGQFASAWTNWNRFAKEHRYGRHVAIGAGIYLNTVSNSLVQMRHTRTATAAGHRAEGLSLYSYAVPASDGTTRATFLAALTQTNVARLHETNATPLFPSPTNPPVMPWKTTPTRGHLKGFVFARATNAPLDGAVVTLTGPVTRALVADASGFFGAVDLPPGAYTVACSETGLTASASVMIPVGAVAHQDLILQPEEPPYFTDLRTSAGERGALLGWRTRTAAACEVAVSRATNLADAATFQLAHGTNHVLELDGLLRGTSYFFQVTAFTATGAVRSAIDRFATAGDVVVDNPAATFTGAWTTGSTATGRHGSDYRYTGTTDGAATATATYAAALPAPGLYDVEVCYPQGSNRATNAPFVVSWNGGSLTNAVNQTANGGAWRPLALARPFAREGGFVRLLNAGEPAKVVIADAVRFRYVSSQDTPGAGSVPAWWSDFHFGGPVDGSLDPDGDGYTTAEEYVLGTRPDAAGSALTVMLMAGSPTRLVFAPARMGRAYRLEVKYDLAASEWLPVAAPAPEIGGGVGTFVLPYGPSPAFYRLRVDWVP